MLFVYFECEMGLNHSVEGVNRPTVQLNHSVEGVKLSLSNAQCS